MQKSADAYRTIGEVAEALKLPQHVLRFWEIRFPQVKPMKRGGNRRFYRPEDVDLLRAIRILLYEDGYTIKGVQRILKEQGPRAIAGRVLDATLPADVESSRARPAGAARPGAPDPVAHRDPRRGSEALSKAVVDPPRPAARPAEPRQEGAASLARPGPAPRVAAAFAAAAAPASLAGRLEAILADLAECARILAAARDGRDV